MHDIIGDPFDLDKEAADTLPCFVLEWLDCTLTDVPAEAYRRNHVLLKAVMYAGLSGLAELNKENLVHTGKASSLTLECEAD